MLYYDFSYFFPLKKLVMHKHNKCTTLNQLSDSEDSTSASLQINFLVVVHGRTQDLPRGGPKFLGGWAFARGFGGMLPRKFLLNGAIWCVSEHIFIFFLLKKSKNNHFLYQNDKL